MPYLDNKIEKHHKGCINPVGKRLYIRDYDDEGKQKFVSWGLTCTTCGVVVKEKYERGLTKKEIRKLEIHHKPVGSKYAKLVGELGAKESNDKEYLERIRERKIRNKLERLVRRDLGNVPMTPEESGLRRRIKNLKGFYEYQAYYWSHENIKNSWDQNVLREFLYLAPRPTITELRQVFHLPKSIISVDSQRKFRLRGYVPNPEKEGWLKYDKEAYIELLKSEAQKRIELMQQIIKSREAKQ